MRMDKLTHSLQAALGEAQSLAIGRDHPFIEPLHLLKAMVDPAGSAARGLLLAAGAAVEPLQTSVDNALGAMATVSGSEDVHVSQETQRLLNRADKHSQQVGDTYLSTDAVLLAMQKQVLRGGVGQLCDVLHVATAIFLHFQSLDKPVLLQVLRVSVLTERLQHLANIRECRCGHWLNRGCLRKASTAL